jgi:outer membrane immunogenic protein
MLKRGFLFSCVLSATASTVLAQTPTWTGPYVGVNGGRGAGTSDVTTTQDGIGYFSSVSTEAINEAGTLQLKPKGLIFGGQAGFNKQIGAVVFGIEGDVGASMVDNDVDKDAVTVGYPCCPGSDFTIEHVAETKWLLTVRPRAGIAVGPAFVYATGGIAATKFDFSTVFTDTLASAHADASVSENRMGWTVGAGVEARLGSGAASLKVEYLYADFGEVASSANNLILGDFPVPGETFDFTANLTMNIFRAGVNVRF